MKAINDEEANLNDWLKKSKIRWTQKSRINWLQWSDRDSKFFHFSILARIACNKILAIKNDDGKWIQGQEKIHKVAKY